MYYAVYREDGSLQSTGTVEPVNLPAGLSYKAFNFDVQTQEYQWNPTTRDFDQVGPPKERLLLRDLKRRMTLDERAAILQDADSDFKTAAVLDTLNSLQDIERDNPDVVECFKHLRAKGLFTAARIKELMS